MLAQKKKKNVYIYKLVFRSWGKRLKTHKKKVHRKVEKVKEGNDEKPMFQKVCRGRLVSSSATLSSFFLFPHLPDYASPCVHACTVRLDSSVTR